MINDVLMRYIFVLIFLLSGCSATPVIYKPGGAQFSEKSVSLIEQVIYEQPEKYRPSGVFVNKSFIGFDNGISSNTRAITSSVSLSKEIRINSGSSSTDIRNISDRFYFNSMKYPKLFRKRSWFIIQFIDSEERAIKNIYTRSEIKAKRFIDHISHLVDQAESSEF